MKKIEKIKIKEENKKVNNAAQATCFRLSSTKYNYQIQIYCFRLLSG